MLALMLQHLDVDLRIYFSQHVMCTCSMLMFNRILEHVSEDLCRCWH